MLSAVTDKLVTLLTFGSIFPILLVRLVDPQSTIFWIYSVSITVFLIFMYLTTRGYRPTPDMGLRPQVTVVIPAKNEEEVIESVVRTAFNSDYPSARLEVIVVDDGSSDRTWERVQRVKLDPELSDRLVLVKHDRNYGKRVALASGIARAHSEIVVCLDSDSFVDRDAIRLLVQPFHDNKVVAVCGHGEALNKDEGVLPKLQHYWYAEMFRLAKGMESRFGCVTCCSGVLSAYRRSVILPILNEWLNEKLVGRQIVMGGEKYPTSWIARGLASKLIRSPGEDRTLTAFALSTRHAKVVYQSNAVVHTMVPNKLKQFLKQQLRWKRSYLHGSILEGRFMWKKPWPMASIFYLYQFLSFLNPAVVVLWLLVKPFQGQWLGAAGFLAGTFYVAFLHGLNTWKYLRTSIESIPYQMMFVFVSFFLTLTVLFYAWSTPWKGGWVTRSEAAPRTPSMASPKAVLVEPVASVLTEGGTS